MKVSNKDFKRLGEVIRGQRLDTELVNVGAPLRNCTLHFLTEHLEMYEQKLEVIYVLKYNPVMANQDKLMKIPSVLGMDFLKNYKLSFSDKHVVLER